jgi:hypothetical protein
VEVNFDEQLMRFFALRARRTNGNHCSTDDATRLLPSDQAVCARSSMAPHEGCDWTKDMLCPGKTAKHPDLQMLSLGHFVTLKVTH